MNQHSRFTLNQLLIPAHLVNLFTHSDHKPLRKNENLRNEEISLFPVPLNLK